MNRFSGEKLSAKSTENYPSLINYVVNVKSKIYKHAKYITMQMVHAYIYILYIQVHISHICNTDLINAFILNINFEMHEFNVINIIISLV